MIKMKFLRPADAGYPQRRGSGALVAGATLLTGALLAGSASLSAFAQSWSDVIAAAKKEGKIALYSATPPVLGNRLVAGFKKAYPDIDVEFSRGPSGQLIAKIEQEKGQGLDGADVLISTEVEWFRGHAKKGELLKPVGPEMTAWPAKYLREGAIVTVGYEPFTIWYNTKLVTSNPPQSYADLLRPEYKGRVGSSGLAATTLIAWYDWLEKTEGADYLIKFRAQNPKLYNGTTPAAQALAAGEIAVSGFSNITSFKGLAEKGAPIKMVLPKNGLGFEFAMGAVAWSKRPNAARVWLNYVMSREGQTVWHGSGDGASPRKDVPGAIPIEDITPWDTSAYPKDVADKYRARWNKIFK